MVILHLWEYVHARKPHCYLITVARSTASHGKVVLQEVTNMMHNQQNFLFSWFQFLAGKMDWISDTDWLQRLSSFRI